jgi:hypothetical protein
MTGCVAGPIMRLMEQPTSSRPPWAPPAVAPHVAPVAAPVEWHIARLQAAQWHAANPRRVVVAQPASRRRSLSIAGALATGAIAAAATSLIMMHEPAAAYSLESASSSALETTTMTYEARSTVDGTETSTSEIELDLDDELMLIEMHDQDFGDTEYIVDVDRNIMYADADLFEVLGTSTEGADWVVFDLDDTDADVSDVSGEVTDNPLDVVRMFDAANGVDDLGFATVRGEQVKHYAVSVDRDALAFEHHAGRTDEVTRRGLINDGEPAALDDIVFDVYVNRANQLARVAYEIDHLAMHVEIELTVTGVNQPVDIQVPNRSDVVDWDDLYMTATVADG